MVSSSSLIAIEPFWASGGPGPTEGGFRARPAEVPPGGRPTTARGRESERPTTTAADDDNHDDNHHINHDNNPDDNHDDNHHDLSQIET